jgi:hypothetical protein
MDTHAHTHTYVNERTETEHDRTRPQDEARVIGCVHKIWEGYGSA